MMTSLDTEKKTWHSPIPIHDKKSHETRNKREIFKHDKKHLENIYSYVIHKGKKLEVFPLKMPLFMTPFQYYTGGSVIKHNGK